MEPTATPGEIRVDLFVRSLRPGNWQAKQDRVLDRLESLVDEGVIDGFDVYVWGSAAPPSADRARTAFGRFVLDRIAAFEEWAHRNDRSLGELFAECEVESSITGESRHCRRLPAMAMAEYHDGRLRCVTPHQQSGETIRVLDRATELGIRPEHAGDLRSVEVSGRPEPSLPARGFEQSGSYRNADRTGRERTGDSRRAPDARDFGSGGEESELGRRQ